MANKEQTKNPSGIDQVEVEPLTDEDLESVSGGTIERSDVVNNVATGCGTTNNSTTGPYPQKNHRRLRRPARCNAVAGRHLVQFRSTKGEELMEPVNLCFEDLIYPVTPQTFLDEYWENKYLYVSRHSDSRFENLFSLCDVDRWLMSVRSGLPDSILLTAPQGAESGAQVSALRIPGWNTSTNPFRRGTPSCSTYPRGLLAPPREAGEVAE